MSLEKKNKTILLLSLPLAALVIIVSCVGLFTPGFYSAETPNWQAQSIGQDIVDLFLITPCLLVTAFFAYRNNRAATFIWGGTALYLTYTFVLYCFEVHFNKLFVLYCLALSLSFYSLLYFLFSNHSKNTMNVERSATTRLTAIYFIVIAVLFYFLWLSEIIPSVIQNKVPESVSDTGLFTNGVQVLDLAILLPAILMTGIFLLRNASMGYVMAPVLLSFFVLMDITIGMLTFIMKIKGIESNLIITFIMGVLALISLLLLIGNLKNERAISS